MSYVKDDRAAYEAETKKILAINPAFGEVYRVAADLAARNYRFDEAVALSAGDRARSEDRPRAWRARDAPAPNR